MQARAAKAFAPATISNIGPGFDVLGLAIDAQTMAEMGNTYLRTGHLTDPHTAVGLAAARIMLAQRAITPPVIVAATAHPAKFPEIVRDATGCDVPIPPSLQEALHRRKITIRMKASDVELRKVLESTGYNENQ